MPTFNPNLLRLGKRAARVDRRTLRLTKYLRELPPPPTAIYAPPDVAWGMMKNDEFGCCTCAAAGHQIQAWTFEALGRAGMVTPTDGEIMYAYSQVSGWTPCNKADNGAVMLDVLNYWRKTGIAKRPIEAFAAINLKDRIEVRQAVHLFGGVYTGLLLPSTASGQDVWDVVPGMIAGTWGGHAVNVIGYDSDGLVCVTWGALQRLTWAFWDTICDEAYAVLSKDMIGPGGLSHDNLDLDTLREDLARVTA